MEIDQDNQQKRHKQMMEVDKKIKTYIEIYRSFFMQKFKKIRKNYCILKINRIKYGQSGTKWRKVEQKSSNKERGGTIC